MHSVCSADSDNKYVQSKAVEIVSFAIEKNVCSLKSLTQVTGDHRLVECGVVPADLAWIVL